jgi:signal transduction histidine kinase
MNPLIVSIGVILATACLARLAWLEYRVRTPPAAAGESLRLAAALDREVAERRRVEGELRAFEQRFNGYMDNGPFCAYLKDADGRYVYVNACTRRLFPRPWIGHTDAELFPPDLASDYAVHDRDVLENDRAKQFDEVSPTEGGGVRHWSSVKFPVRDERGRRFIAGISHETTASRVAEERLRASESQLLLALDAGRMGIWSVDVVTHELSSSRTFAILHGRPPERTNLTFEESLESVHPADRELVIAAFARVKSNEAPERVAYRVVWPDESVHWIEVVGRVFEDDAGRPSRVAGVCTDVTEIRRAFAALENKEKLLRNLIDIQEREKQLLCQEFHDGLIQYAVGSRLMIESCRRRFARPADADAAADGEPRSEAGGEAAEAGIGPVLDEVIGYLGKGVEDGRRVIRGIRPAVLDDLGLEAGIEDLVGQFNTPETTVTFSGAPDCSGLPKSLQLTVYRIIQESLNNAHKHGGAAHVVVRLRRQGDDLFVEVADDGCGFDATAVRDHGFGLLGMAERARLCGGECVVHSGRGAGTTILVRLPVQEREPAGGGSLPVPVSGPAAPVPLGLPRV